MNHDKETLEAAEKASDHYFIKVRPKERTLAEILNEEYAYKCGFHLGVAYAREKQGEEIAKLKAKLERAKKALEFYSRIGGAADTDSQKGCWILVRRFIFGEAIKTDYEDIPMGESQTIYKVAGRKAREALKELDE